MHFLLTRPRLSATQIAYTKGRAAMRHSTRIARVLANAWLLAGAASLLTPVASAQLRVDSIASEGLNQIKPQGLSEGYGPGLSEDGTVGFWGSTPPHTNQSVIYVGDPAGLWSIDTRASGLSRPRSIKLNGDSLVFIADGAQSRGAYVVDRAGGKIVALNEQRAPGKLPPYFEIALSREGTIAYATICSDCDRAGGGLFVGSRFGTFTRLQKGTIDGGPFLYNTQWLDVNDRGQVAVQAEYMPAYRRGLFAFERPDEALAVAQAVAENLPVSSQPRPAINNQGEIAYILDQTQIWIGKPSVVGGEKQARVFLDTSGPYAAFERVDLDDHGTIVFQAKLDDGRTGIFVGPDPEAHKVLVTGQRIDGRTIGAVHIMGEVNQQRQLAVIASVEPQPDMHVLRVSNLPATPR